MISIVVQVAWSRAVVAFSFCLIDVANFLGSVFYSTLHKACENCQGSKVD